jgi:Trk-type K+ transport systems, membrane components
MKSKIFGILLLFETLFLLMTALVALYYNKTCGETDLNSFLITAGITGSVGLLLYVIGRKNKKALEIKDSYLIVSFTWVLFSIFGMLPFLIYGTVDNVTDAFFETMSGFTTTGSTVLNNIDEQPHGILFWRSIIQWLGGLGIIVFALAFMPSVIRGSKKRMFFGAESSGLNVEKLQPKMQGTALNLWIIYIVLTLLCTVSYWIGPMSLYDAVCHAFTTIATGGFSTHQQSIGYFHSNYIEYVCSIFMLLSGVNFAMYYFASVRKFNLIRKNEETRTFLIIVFILVILFSLLFYIAPNLKTTTEAQINSYPKGANDIIRTSLFHVSTIISSTGYQAVNFDYDIWGLYFLIPTLFMMVSGSCAGSTSGGIKIIRLLVISKYIKNVFREFSHPTALFSVKVSGQSLEQSTVMRVCVFMALYFILLAVTSVALTLTGLSFQDSFYAFVTCMGNCGPGANLTGPSYSFSELPVTAKWILSFTMLLGRLEIFTVFILFTKSFWKAQ